MTQYWFARRFPVGHPRNAMAPVSPEGFRAVRSFIFWMIGGAVAAGLLLLVGFATVPLLTIFAPLLFAVCAAIGSARLLKVAQERGDQGHTVDDYKQGRVQNG